MKRLTAILMALSLAFPAWAAAELDVNMEQKEENGQTLTVFSAAEAGAAETTAAPEETPDPALATANGLIEARFEQAKAAQLTQRAGNFLVGRTEQSDFKWEDLKGKKVLGGRAGGMPQMVFEYILKKHGIDPKTDLTIDQSISFGLTAAAFTSGDADYTVEFEPFATTLEMEKCGAVVASLGKESGYVPYTAYCAKKSYIEKNPQVIQKFTNAIQRGLDYVNAHSAWEIAKTIQPQFKDTPVEKIAVIIDRYKSQDTWKEDTVFEKDSFDLLENILEEAGELKKRVPYEELVRTDFSINAAEK